MDWNLKTLRQTGVIDPFDRHFSLRLSSLAPNTPELVQVALALVRRGLGKGHVGMPLNEILQSEYPGVPAIFNCPTPDQIREILLQSSLVASPEGRAPLILDGDWLFLQKYHAYQERLLKQLKIRCNFQEEPLDDLTKEAWAKLYGPEDEQGKAALKALGRRFFILTGGPGTGKTSTAVSLIALIQDRQIRNQKPTLETQLLAPTGKAARRLGEAVALGKSRLGLSEVLGIPETAQTLHRFLGVNPNQPGIYKHHPKNPAATQLVLLDEASMVDLPMFVHFLEALSPDCRVILMGDPDQLTAIESGAVLKDLTSFPAQLSVGEAPRLALHHLRLNKSYRFDDQKGIGKMATQIRSGIVESQTWSESGLQVISNLNDLKSLVISGFSPLIAAQTPAEALAALPEFACLCPLVEGPSGALAWNRQIANWVLGQPGLGHLCPIIIEQNSPSQGLSNGDLGVLWANGTDLEAWVLGPEGMPVCFSPALLPKHSQAFCISVHKSQGSEYGQVVTLMPESDHPLLTGELIYTALTRAKTRFTLYGDPVLWSNAAQRNETRFSLLNKRAYSL